MNRTRKRLAAVLAVGLGVTLSAVFGQQPAHASNPVPYPAALVNHPFAKQWTNAEMAGSTWNSPPNTPGNCPDHPSAVSLNSAGNVELDTTGQQNDCVAIESPHKYPTNDGYVYEAKFYVSSNKNWPAVWGFGDPWPTPGEIDASEYTYETNFVTFHYAPCQQGISSSAKGTDPWTYTCKTTLTPNAGVPNLTPGWHIVDYAFGGDRMEIFYDGQSYVSIPENVTQSGSGGYWLVFSDGSCAQASANVCGSPSDVGVAGNLQIAYFRVFT